jgi:cell division protein FtsB
MLKRGTRFRKILLEIIVLFFFLGINYITMSQSIKNVMSSINEAISENKKFLSKLKPEIPSQKKLISTHVENINLLNKQRKAIEKLSRKQRSSMSKGGKRKNRKTMKKK